MLIPANQGPQVVGLHVPGDLYWVLKAPAPLAGMRLPRPNWPWAAIYESGFSCLVSLHPCSQNPSPLATIFAEHLEDLVGGGPPRNPQRKVGLISVGRYVPQSNLSNLAGALSSPAMVAGVAPVPSSAAFYVNSAMRGESLSRI